MPKRKHRTKKRRLPLATSAGSSGPTTIQISFPQSSSQIDDSTPATTPSAPVSKATASNKKLNKTLAIAGGSIGGALAVGAGGYYGYKKYGSSGGNDDLYYDEEPHISVPTTDPDPVASSLNTTIGELESWV